MNAPDPRPPRGFPAAADARHAYDEADLARALNVYKFFYPTVSGAAIIKGNEAVGLVPNQVFGIMDCKPAQVGFTLNSDTPYGPLLLDLSIGPLVIELPPGPLIVCSIDVNQRWVADMGLPGPDAGKGGKHLLVPPAFEGTLPAAGYHLHWASSNRQIVGIRSLPVQGNVREAKERLHTVKVYPLDPKTPWSEPTWLDITDQDRMQRRSATKTGSSIGKCSRKRWTPSRRIRATTPSMASWRCWASRRASLLPLMRA